MKRAILYGVGGVFVGIVAVGIARGAFLLSISASAANWITLAFAVAFAIAGLRRSANLA